MWFALRMANWAAHVLVIKKMKLALHQFRYEFQEPPPFYAI